MTSLLLILSLNLGGIAVKTDVNGLTTLAMYS